MRITTTFQLATLALAVAASGALTACSAVDDGQELNLAVEKRIADRPLVGDVQRSYVPADQGSSEDLHGYAVTLTDDATLDDAKELVRAVHAEYSGTDQRWLGEISVSLGDDQITLETRPEEVGADEAVARLDAATEVLEAAAVRTTIDAKTPDLASPALALGFTEMTVDGGAAEVVAALTDAEEAYATTFPDARWSATTSQSQAWTLTGAAAFPDAEERAQFLALAALAGKDGVVATDGDVTQLTFAASTPDARVLDITLEQLDVLGGVAPAYAHVSRESAFAAWLDRGSCSFEDDHLGRLFRERLTSECSTVEEQSS
ncbi:hypothetical protein [Nocardioides yefusunii]|uniref:Uncharacterized protein n=1 Tax=Nocardioides yefusunii TaxID=2500546 RepID=A0ABW1QUD8_9ACTN|nr:hypothetical protein [Nocardioides yefusunii]